MICAKCDKDIAACQCDDATLPGRIDGVLNCKYLVIGPDYRRRLETAKAAAIKRNNERQAVVE